jgi:hypothetical protein
MVQWAIVIPASSPATMSPSRCLLPSSTVLALALALALAAGCSTPGPGPAIRDSWVRATEAELVAAWGEPTRRRESGDVRRLEFEAIRTLVVPSMPSGGRAMGVPDAPPVEIVAKCTTTFLVQGGRVASWTADGNDCRYAPVPARPAS